MSMQSKLEEKKKKLDKQIEKFELKKKLLEAKERKKQASKFSEIGRIASKAKIDHLDEHTLLGAFIEIANQQNEKCEEWKKHAEEFNNPLSKESEQVFSIYFKEEPSKEIKKYMKESKFIWNRFRREYYGRGNKKDLENLLKGYQAKIEEIQH